MSDQGVNISLREIYDSIQEVRNDVKMLGPKISQMEKDVNKGVEAHSIASEALKLATEQAENKKWLWRTVIGALVVAVVSALIGFIVLATQVMVTNNLPAQDIKIDQPNE